MAADVPDDASMFDATRCEVVRMPPLRRDIAYWGVPANRDEDRSSKKRKARDDDTRHEMVPTSGMHAPRDKFSGIGEPRRISLDDDSDDDSVDGADGAVQQPGSIRRSPSNSVNSESMFSAASTRAASVDWTRTPDADTECRAPASKKAALSVRSGSCSPSGPSGPRPVAAHRTASAPKRGSGRSSRNWLEEARGELEMDGPLLGAYRSNAFA